MISFRRCSLITTDYREERQRGEVAIDASLDDGDSATTPSTAISEEEEEEEESVKDDEDVDIDKEDMS